MIQNWKGENARIAGIYEKDQWNEFLYNGDFLNERSSMCCIMEELHYRSIKVVGSKR